MNKYKVTNVVLGIFFLGSLWGFIEASFGDWLYTNTVAPPSIYLTTLAICILASSKEFYKYRWTGTALGAIAMLFKFVNMPFFACHLLAIFLLGFGFDLAYELISRFYRGTFRLPIIGLIGTYCGRALFATIITYLVRYSYWTEAGISKVIDYIFITGTVSAILGSIAVPIGNRLANRILIFSRLKLRPQISTATVFTASAGIWILQIAL